MKRAPTLADWESYIYERLYGRDQRRRRRADYSPVERQLTELYLSTAFKGFSKVTFESVEYEDVFRDHFIEKMIAPNFTHYRKETQLFDIVAYRTLDDSNRDTPWYVWKHYLEDPNHPTVKHYLSENNLETLPEPAIFPGGRLLYGFELKTDSDNEYHFLDQLPRYASLFDRVILVIGESLRPPKRLPEWVEVLQRKGDGYVKLKSGWKAHTFLGVNAFDPAKWYMPHSNADYGDFDYSGAASFSEFVGFLRRCAISALFKSEEVEPYTNFDRAIYDTLRFWRKRTGEVVRFDEAGVPTIDVKKLDELIEVEVQRRVKEGIEEEVDRRLSQQGTVVEAPAPGEGKTLNRLVPKSLTDFAVEKQGDPDG